MSQISKLPKTKDGQIDYSKDFFGKPSFLTCSGQLNGETYATAMGDIYTFGPTFRAENSQTTKHLAEFWMIEPELAFTDLAVRLPTQNYAQRGHVSAERRCLGFDGGPRYRRLDRADWPCARSQGNMANAEAFVKHVVKYAMETCPDDLQFFNDFYDKTLLERLKAVVEKPFGRIEYKDAIVALQVRDSTPLYSRSSTSRRSGPLTLHKVC